jgi:hypothetical protein
MEVEPIVSYLVDLVLGAVDDEYCQPLQNKMKNRPMMQGASPSFLFARQCTQVSKKNRDASTIYFARILTL